MKLNGLKFGIIVIMIGATVQAAAQAPRKSFPNSISEIPSGPGEAVAAVPLASVEKSQKIAISFWFSGSGGTELDSAIKSGKPISGEDMLTKYGASAENYQALLSWLKKEGFEITHTTKDHTAIRAVGTVAQVEKSLDVKMERVTVHGRQDLTPNKPPSLPADIGAKVAGIGGLQTWQQAVKNSERPRPIPTPAVASLTAHQPPYKPADLLLAYGGANLALDGSGQTIAILIDILPNPQDVRGFWRAANVPGSAARLKLVPLNGAQSSSPEGEETLDTEWTTGVAPGAEVKVYAAGSLQFTDLDTALDQILEDASTDKTLRVVSISLGLGETYMSSDEALREHDLFRRLAALGVNVFVASGDAGSNPDLTGHNLGGTPGPQQVEYQSSDPYVIAVGGTTLEMSSAGSIVSENGWPGSGGGVSKLFRRPAWQNIQSPSGDMRAVPDVSSAADPQSGAMIFIGGSPDTIGGTSWSAPTWAGICALINQARTKAGKQALPFLGPALYANSNASGIRQILKGSNGAYSAGTGYNAVTGLGVPNIGALVTILNK